MATARAHAQESGLAGWADTARLPRCRAVSTGQAGVGLEETGAVACRTYSSSCFLSLKLNNFTFFFFFKEGNIYFTNFIPYVFVFPFPFTCKGDEKNHDGEEQAVRDDNRPKGREEPYEEEEEEEEDGAAAAEKSQRRAEMQGARPRTGLSHRPFHAAQKSVCLLNSRIFNYKNQELRPFFNFCIRNAHTFI